MWDWWRHGEAGQIFRFLIIVLQKAHLSPGLQVTADWRWLANSIENPLGIFFFILNVCLSIKKIFFKRNILDLQRTFLIWSKQASKTWPAHLLSQDWGYLLPSQMFSPIQLWRQNMSSGVWCLMAGAQLAASKSGNTAGRGHCTQAHQPCLWQSLSAKKLHWCGCRALPR